MTKERKEAQNKIERLAGRLSESLLRCQPKITDEQIGEVGALIQEFIICAYNLGAAEMRAEIIGTVAMAAKMASAAAEIATVPGPPNIREGEI